jgi:hypothetical protein
MKRFFQWLIRGWFQRPVVGEIESFLLRAFFATIVAYTLREPVKYTTEPHPVGILRLLHAIDDHHTWLTWLAEKDAAGNFATFDTWRAIIYVLLGCYIFGLGLPLVLPALGIMHTLPFTLYDSWGYTHHGNQIVSLLLLTQAGTVIYDAFAERRLSFGPPAAALRGRLLWMSVTLIAGTYFVSVITKLHESGGLWMWNANYFALDMIKTERQNWLNHLDAAHADIPSNAMWMIRHPWVGRAVFGSGILLEAATIFAIGNRLSAFLLGLSLIVMHRCIDALMGGVAFTYNEYLDFTFLVGIPFGIAWLLERWLSLKARWGFMMGALAALPLSWWMFHPGPERIATATFYGYLQALVNCLDLWTAQNWDRFWIQSGPLWLTGAACAAAGALIASRLPSKKGLAA